MNKQKINYDYKNGISCCPECDKKGILTFLIAEKQKDGGYIGKCTKCDYIYKKEN